MMDARRLEACFAKGQQILAKTGDRNLAHALFAECVREDPGQLAYAEAFLDNLSASHPSKKQHRIVSRAMAIRRSAWRSDWTSVLEHGAHRLSINPWHVATLLRMASACQALHYNEVELRYLKQALDAAPHSEEVNMRCALSLARMGQFDQAMACWKRLEGSKRFGPMAREKVYQLAIDKADAARHPPVTAVDSPQEVGADAEDSESQGDATDEMLAARDSELDWEAFKPLAAPNRSESTDDEKESPDWKRRFTYRPGFLEVALVLVTASLIVQLSPTLQAFLWENIRVVAFLANFIFVVGLIVYRQMQQNRS